MPSVKNTCVITLSLIWMICTQLTRADEVNTIPKSGLKGNFSLLVSLVPLGEYLQYTHANILSNEPTSESGYGFTLDFADGQGNAFALDYYSLTEEASRPATGSNDNGYFESLSIAGPVLGYRYHYPMGFYTGLGFWYPETIVKKNRNQSLAYKPELLGVFMLGINGILDSGFTLGAHFIYSLPATLEVDRSKNDFTALNNAEAGVIQDNGELKGLQVSSLSFKLGYSW